MTFLNTFIPAILIFLQLMIYPLTSFAEELVVIHAKNESVSDSRYDYQWEVLEAALAATKDEGPYVIREAEIVMTERRLVEELNHKTGSINILRDNSSKKMESLLLPIKIPLLKGAKGWRIFLIRKDKRADITKMTSLDDLKTLNIGQGQGWEDVQILRKNGFQVMEVAKYEGLFKMLMAKRFELFSRAIIEAPLELDERKHKFPDMAIEEKFVLRYPFVEYFFVNKEDKALAARIERGLNTIIDNGTMDNLFDKYFSKLFKPLNLNKRVVFDIENPTIGEIPPLDKKELWLDHYLQTDK
jgi:hypothetical protein